MNVDNLIADMQAVKAAHPTLELADILRIFHIQATKDLANEIMLMRMKRGG